jgi:catechol 2,3-dioxygenase-like lactoylglutathione lyase family enzyme
MPGIQGLDHVSLTVADIDASCDFYRRVLGATQVFDYAPSGRSLVRLLQIGGARLSVHQAGNGIDLVAARPTSGSADFCLRWDADMASAVALLAERRVPIIDGPSPRESADGRASHSVYFRDPDGNLVEIMASDLTG